MGKTKSVERRKASDIRCQVKREYENKLLELKRDIAVREEIIQRKDEEINRLKCELEKIKHCCGESEEVTHLKGEVNRLLRELMKCYSPPFRS